MKKSDLKSGMVVEVRNGDRYLLIEDSGEIFLLGYDGFNYMHSYEEDLTMISNPDYDIVRVWSSFPAGFKYLAALDPECAVVWTREETREITAEEAFRILKEHYGCPVKIIDEV